MSMHFVKHDRMTHVAGDFGELAFLHDPEFFFLKKKKKSKPFTQDIRSDIQR